MARKRRHRAERPRPPAAPGRWPRVRAFARSLPGAATGLATIVGSVAAVVALVDTDRGTPRVSKSSATGSAALAPPPPSQVVEVCELLDRAQARARRRRLALVEAIERSDGTFEQRDAVLEAVQAGLAESTDALTVLKAAEVGAGMARAKGDTVSAWEDHVAQTEQHVDALVDVAGFDDLVVAVTDVDRRSLSETAREIRTGVRRLGGARCRIAPPPPPVIVRLKKPGGGYTREIVHVPTDPRPSATIPPGVMPPPTPESPE